MSTQRRMGKKGKRGALQQEVFSQSHATVSTNSPHLVGVTDAAMRRVSSTSDNGHYGNLVGRGRAGWTLRPITPHQSKQGMRDIMAVIRSWLQSQRYVVNGSVDYSHDGMESDTPGAPHPYGCAGQGGGLVSPSGSCVSSSPQAVFTWPWVRFFASARFAPWRWASWRLAPWRWASRR
jgi:hypothetical protein